MLGKLYAFLILERDEPLPLDGGAAQSEGGMKQAELRQLLREHRYEELQFASSCALSHRRTLLVLKTPDNSTFHTYDLMRRNALRLQAALAERTAGATTLYLTMRPMNFYEFRRFLQNNPDVFERKYFLPEDALILLERIPPRSAPVPRLDRPAFEALLDAGDADGAEAFLQALYAALTDCADLRALLSCSQELYFALAHRAEALPEHTAWNTPDDRAQWRSAACIGRWLTEKTRALLAALADVRRSAYSRPVSDAIAYVRAHYSEPELSLNDVADSLHLSVGYLCMLFKQETGVTLKNHITDVRIEEAKRLLRTGHAKIYEICTAVGYPNSQYFSQVFYKRSACTRPNTAGSGGMRHEARQNHPGESSAGASCWWVWQAFSSQRSCRIWSGCRCCAAARSRPPKTATRRSSAASTARWNSSTTIRKISPSPCSRTRPSSAILPSRPRRIRTSPCSR